MGWYLPKPHGWSVCDAGVPKFNAHLTLLFQTTNFIQQAPPSLPLLLSWRLPVLKCSALLDSCLSITLPLLSVGLIQFSRGQNTTLWYLTECSPLVKDYSFCRRSHLTILNMILHADAYLPFQVIVCPSFLWPRTLRQHHCTRQCGPP